jgi:putative PEP-CTERM system histidine kinase
MIDIVVGISSAVCLGATFVGVVQMARGGKRGAGALLPFLLPAGAVGFWTVASLLYGRAPFSGPRARLLLATCCLVHAPWLLAALAVREGGFGRVWVRWQSWIVLQAVVAAAAAAAMWLEGVDWITGIGSEPAVVLSRVGLLAIAASSVASGTALAVAVAGVWRGAPATPLLFAGIAGGTASLLWLSGTLLWGGYLALHTLTSMVALGAVAAAVWVAGTIREAPVAPALRPSRNLVYWTAAASLVGAYVLAARIAVDWLVSGLRTTMPGLLPAIAFAAGTGLLLIASSRRWRHRLWVAVGQHLFRSKHDYGQVWIRLTELVGAAWDGADLVQRTAAFCRDVLCVPEVAIWLIDPNGGFVRAAVACEPGAAGPEPSDGHQPGIAMAGKPARRGAVPAPLDEGALAAATGAHFATPMAVKGRVTGVLAVGSVSHPATVDDEDRTLLRHIAAQIGSALSLYELGEEIADAREVASFHRLSAFLMHDLKNLVAQQSFVLQNAKRFAHDPRFVTDALDAFADSTDRMRTLIERLRSGAVEESAEGTTCDLLALLRELLASPALASLPTPVRLSLPEQLEECPVTATRSAMAQVFTNVLVNAVESLPLQGGAVAVAITPAPGGWTVEVRDNGCGIAPDFLRHHLFRPFRTTKDEGLGIGMYQCKTIVEAAGGTIAVSSAEHAGTTVTVTLPVPLHPSAPASTRDGEQAQPAHH